MLEAAPYEMKVDTAEIQTTIPPGLEPVGTLPHATDWEATVTVSVLSVNGAKQ